MKFRPQTKQKGGFKEDLFWQSHCVAALKQGGGAGEGEKKQTTPPPPIPLPNLGGKQEWQKVTL